MLSSRAKPSFVNLIKTTLSSTLERSRAIKLRASSLWRIGVIVGKSSFKATPISVALMPLVLILIVEQLQKASPTI